MVLIPAGIDDEIAYCAYMTSDPQRYNDHKEKYYVMEEGISECIRIEKEKQKIKAKKSEEKKAEKRKEREKRAIKKQRKQERKDRMKYGRRCKVKPQEILKNGNTKPVGEDR